MSEDVSSEGSAHAELPRAWRFVRPGDLWAYWGIIAFVWLRVLFLIFGGLGEPLDRLPSYVTLASVMTLVALSGMAQRHWLLRIDGQAIQLEIRGQVRWRFLRQDLRTWQPEVFSGGLKTLLITDHGGGVWSLSFGRGLDRQKTKQVIEALGQWAPDDTELPANPSPIPWWGYCIAAAFTIGAGIFLYLMLR